MTAAFSFGPLGAMRDLKVSVGVSVEREGALSRFTSSGGFSYFQRPRRAPRSWLVGRLWKDPGFIKFLERAAHGLGGEVFLYDRAVARRNMLPAELSGTPGAGVVVDGASLAPVTWPRVEVPLLAGRLYTISCWTPDTASPLTVLFTGPGTRGPMATPDHKGRSQMSFTPTQDGMLTLTRETQVVSGVRVHEGSPDGSFYATSGTPCRVAVEIPDETYQLVTDQETRTDYRVTLREAGRTGYY